METIHQQMRMIKINGHEIQITLKYMAGLDDNEIEGSFDFGSEEKNRTYLERFASGELENIALRVEATYLDAEGWDQLGGSHQLASDGIPEYLEQITQHGMVETAIEELIKDIQIKIERYSILKEV